MGPPHNENEMAIHTSTVESRRGSTLENPDASADMVYRIGSDMCRQAPDFVPQKSDKTTLKTWAFSGEYGGYSYRSYS